MGMLERWKGGGGGHKLSPIVYSGKMKVITDVVNKIISL